MGGKEGGGVRGGGQVTQHTPRGDTQKTVRVGWRWGGHLGVQSGESALCPQDAQRRTRRIYSGSRSTSARVPPFPSCLRPHAPRPLTSGWLDAPRCTHTRAHAPPL